ncbi:MAG: hypothetical protein ABIY70_08750 [Capsulimonas sp.]|uniref:hypothetical protein n=1 Tax=Capsulimonas sp. TaxID=2494211 RepID=UPI0032671F4D
MTAALDFEPLCAMSDDSVIIGAFVQGHICENHFREALRDELAKPIGGFDYMDEEERATVLSAPVKHQYFHEINDEASDTTVYYPVSAGDHSAYPVTVTWWESQE